MVVILSAYIHNWDPVLLDIIGPLKLRWYGLAYLFGFIAGYLLLRFLAKKKLWVFAEEKVADFVAYAAFLGVFLGGRLGYIFFYQIPRPGGWEEFLNDPFLVFRVWEGGMASHGGILGLLFFTLFYAKKNKVSWLGLADGLCAVGPIGIFFVRFANFINGELYGRVASGYGWLMKFPMALYENGKASLAMSEISNLAPQVLSAHSQHEQIGKAIELSREDPAILQMLGKYLQTRHPSQLYQALLEGLVLFLILFSLKIGCRKLPRGIITGLFFLLYALFRIVVENFREPDSAMIWALTKGQFYSLFMIVIGLGFVAFSIKFKASAHKDRVTE